MSSRVIPRLSLRRAFFALVVTVPCAVAAFVAGCGDDDAVVTTKDAASEATTEASTGDGAPADGGLDGAALQERGKYLVEHVAACGDCHTPRLPTGAPDMTKHLSGVDCFVDANGPDAGGGCLSSANLTNHPTGLKNRTDQEVKTMFMDGKRPDGKNLAPVMPYFIFHNLRAEDADAIVAYLRTVPGVDHTAKANEPPFADIPAPATPIDPSTIPPATGDSANNGRYLAAMAGVCIDCHTPELPPTAVRPIDMTMPFAGGRAFPAAAFNLPVPPFPETIYSANLTRHSTGLVGWTAQDIVRELKQGKDRDGGGICPPMPVGPNGPFGGLTDQDALDIANYVLSLPPVDHAIDGGNGSCKAP